MSVSRYPALWIFVLVVLIMPFLTPYLPMAWYVKHGLMGNLQCALLGLAAFGCLYGYTRMQAQTARWVWLGDICADVLNPWPSMAMAALSSLASAADIGLVAIDWVSICGRAWQFRSWRYGHYPRRK